MNELSEIRIEIEQDLYDQLSTICHNAGTRIEDLTVAFLKFCTIPENLPLLRVFLGIERAPSEEGADREVCNRVLCGVFDLL